MKNLSGSNNYKQAKVASNVPKLTPGAYKLLIKSIKYQDNSDKGWNDKIVIAFDIAEGEYKDHFKQRFDADTSEDKKWKGVYRVTVPKDDGSEADQLIMNSFKTFQANVEESNPGYAWNWDEQTLKGKYIGGVFGEIEYDFDGRNGLYVGCRWLCPTTNLDAEKIPEPKLLPGSKASADASQFINVPEGIQEDLPFV